MKFKKGQDNPTLLSLLKDDEIKSSTPIAKNLIDVEKLGMEIAKQAIIGNEANPGQAVAALMYAASITTMYIEKGTKPSCIDLFSDLPVRHYEVIRYSHGLSKLTTDEKAAIYAREAMKIIVKESLK